MLTDIRRTYRHEYHGRLLIGKLMATAGRFVYRTYGNDHDRILMIRLARGKSAKPRVATNALMIDASSEDTRFSEPADRNIRKMPLETPFPLNDARCLRNETRCFRSNAGLVARRHPRMNQEEPRENANELIRRSL